MKDEAPKRFRFGTILAVSVVVPFLLAAVAIWNARESAYRDLYLRADATADLLSVHGESFFNSAEQVLRRGGDWARTAPVPELSADRRIHEELAGIVQQAAVIDALWIFSMDGDHVVSSEAFPVQTRSPQDSEFFSVPLNSQLGEMHVSAPFVSRVTDRVLFAISALLPGPEGEPPAIVVATISPSAVQEFYSRLLPGLDYVVGLTREDGHVLARHPDLGPQLVRLGPQSGLMRALSTPEGRGGGAFTTIAQLGGLERHYVYRPIAGYPIYASVGIATAEATTRWRSEALTFLLLAVVGSAALVLLQLRLRAAQLAQQRADEELAKARIELLQAQKLDALGRLTGGVAHDFNNLLAAVSGAAHQLRRGAGDPGFYLDGIDLAVDRGVRLTKRLLTFARRDPVMPETFDLAAAVASAEPLVEQYGRGDLRIAFGRYAGPLPVSADRGELELSLLNLVSNAVDAMPDGGLVSILTLRRGDLAVLEVADEGQGMPAEVKERALDPFFTTKEPGHGTGLGLPAVQGFARRGGGTIEIESEPGRGTTVRILLPLVTADEPEERPAPGPAAPDVERVLLVEDDALVAMGTKAALTDEGFQVEVARDAREALARLDADPLLFQAVVSDVKLPGEMDGAALVREAAARHPDVRLVVMTGYDPGGLDLPAHVRVLPKPSTGEDVAALLRAPEGAGRSS